MGTQRRDLVDRGRRFGGRILAFAAMVQRRGLVPPEVLGQLCRAGTAIGAHDAEAEAALSRAHLRHLRAGALREARETQYWLAIVADRLSASPDVTLYPEAADLTREVGELVAIHTTIVARLGRPPAPR